MRNTEDQGMSLNLFEYGFLVEDTPANARTMKVSCPKITAMKGDGSKPAQSSVNSDGLANDSMVDVGSANTATTSDYITAKVVLELAHRHKFHDCWPIGSNCVNQCHTAVTCCPGCSDLSECHHYHHDHHFPHNKAGKIPKGTKVILLFMDNNVNDCYVTRLWCEFPDGTTNGTPPAEKMGG